MSYPTVEQFNEALQHPKTAFIDSELQNGTVQTTGLGLPLAFCGGFALTYRVQSGNKKYAVRCFHKKSDNIELRYDAISKKINSLQSSYFVTFKFINPGVNVNGQKAPIVKMAWASGETLGEFVERNYRNRDKLDSLSASLHSLANFLEGKGIAHGDISPENVMVANDGKSIQLIDYDGMYVDEIKSLGSDNDGQRNFQHPKRDSRAWNAQLDRFSLICLSFALRILQSHPHFWDETKSEYQAILFRANDFADPGSSPFLKKLTGITQFSEDAKNFAAICQSPFNKIPTLDEFFAQKNIPLVTISPKSSAVIQQYIGAFPVLDAKDYELCLKYVGDRVELIGKIQEIKPGETRYHKKPYVFINFGPWQGKVVKISIWSEGLDALSSQPDSSWVGKWITVTGLMEPPYQNKKFQYSHLSISITQSNQINFLQESDALYRLRSKNTKNYIGTRNEPANQLPGKRNSDVIKEIKDKTGKTFTLQKNINPPVSPNKDVLEKMRELQGQIPKIPHNVTTPKTYQQPTVNKNDKCFIASAVYGISAPETNILRKWRDNSLLPYLLGRMLTKFYYFVSPSLCKVINRYKTLKRITKWLLDYFVAWVSR